jgi:uncharacterized protein with HEPN domain
MPPRDARAYLWDARDAADAIGRFTHGKAYDDFVRDDLLRSRSSGSSRSSAKH